MTWRQGARQRGQALVETALMMPVLLLALMGAAGIGLVARTDGGVAGVAMEAARAAALASTPAAAEAAGNERAHQVAEGYGLTDPSLHVDVDTSDFRRGGEVRSIVTYRLSLQALPLVGWVEVPLRRTGAQPIARNRSFR